MYTRTIIYVVMFWTQVLKSRIQKTGPHKSKDWKRLRLRMLLNLCERRFLLVWWQRYMGQWYKTISDEQLGDFEGAEIEVSLKGRGLQVSKLKTEQGLSWSHDFYETAICLEIFFHIKRAKSCDLEWHSKIFQSRKLSLSRDVGDTWIENHFSSFYFVFYKVNAFDAFPFFTCLLFHMHLEISQVLFLSSTFPRKMLGKLRSISLISRNEILRQDLSGYFCSEAHPKRFWWEMENAKVFFKAKSSPVQIPSILCFVDCFSERDQSCSFLFVVLKREFASWKWLRCSSENQSPFENGLPFATVVRWMIENFR